ncbi:SDR family oxidoreductase [Acrocarpospora macrocephala]|uniref:Short-chain dehydrogenase n=1 Tax=Acrocarpospora macrocephala TaxID=150177 RepID=A0A5M3WU00_9ACTN|nr:SDR family NAD(P)-dependent oxidoreductase [Acrocarpospora macrocephala]GES12006.1 hypothetical protein Amac_056030 [Acrocarpospora macrocephala]
MIALVTGGTGGIGLEIARNLTQTGASVIVTGRDEDRGAATAAELGARFVRVDHLTVAGNLSLAHHLTQEVSHLDVVVNNVGGAAFTRRTRTAEGHEATLSLNYLGPIALTQALLSLLGDRARIVQIVSSAYTMHTGDPFTEPGTYSAISAYARAKQLNLLATLSLARALAGRARINAANPGMAWTPGVRAMTRDDVPAWRYLWPLMRLIQRRGSPRKAARTPTTLAAEGIGSGDFYEGNGRLMPIPDRLRDPEPQDRALRDVVDLIERR